MTDPADSKTRTGKEFKGLGAKASPAKPVSGKSDPKKGKDPPMEEQSATTEQPPSWLAALLNQQMLMMQQQQKQAQLLIEQQMNAQKQMIATQQKQRQDELAVQEEKRQEEIARQEKLRQEDLERLDKQRQEDIERQERHQEEERELRKAEMAKQQDQWKTELDNQVKLVNDILEKNKVVEEKRLAEMLKLKEVHIADLGGSDDIENYLTTFERVAKTYKWDKKNWVVKLVPHLTGKAQAAFAAMATEDSNDYDKVKEAILRRYDITEETYRQRFRSIKKGETESYREVYVRLKDMFCKWTKPDGITKEQLADIMVMEQLVNDMPPGAQIWVREHKPKTGVEAADLADDYSDARKGINSDKKFQSRNANKGERSASKSMPKSDSKTAQSSTNPKSDFKKSIICRRCQEPGHIERFCKKPVNKEASLITVAKDHEIPPVRSFTFKGTIDGQETEMKIDSCADVVIAHRDLVDPSKIKYKEQIQLECVHGDTMTHPTACVSIQIGDYVHRVEAAINDSPKKRVLIGKNFPNFSKLLELAAQGKLEGLESLVVTRAQARKEREKQEEEYRAEKDCGVVPKQLDQRVAKPKVLDEFGHLESGTFMDKSPKEREYKSRSQKRERKREYADKGSEKMDTGQDEDILDIDVKKMVKLQIMDKTLDVLRRRVLDQKGSKDEQIESKHGILYRKVVPKGQSEVVEQLIVPKPLRAKVLQTAHDIPLSGHLGIKKTLDRITQRFFWPGIRKDVTEYCRSCEPCQLASKYHTKFKAPMISLPVVEQPFERIAMDIVGPLERSKSGNKYVLVICDYSTRYPEAIPLRSIEAKKIANELVKLFSRVGIPKEILTDQGSNFTSKLLKEIYHMLSIRGITTSPYHPQTDGLVERFNGTLKSMIRKFVDKDPRCWDEMLPYLLFAYREVPQESTGFSPFELMYGWKVRGPLDVMKEVWSGSVSGPQNVVSHVVKMRERLASMTDLVRENMEEAQRSQKQWYDKQASSRQFEPGDEVLLLLPSSSNALEAKWLGPYTVTRKVGPVDYEIEMPDRRQKNKVFHVNLLKRYVRRVPEVLIGSAVRVVTGDEEGQDRDLTWSDGSLMKEEVPIKDNLELGQRNELNSLLAGYGDVLRDQPGKTTVIEHDIEMEPGVKPVRQNSYRIPQAKLDTAKREVESMIELGVIEESSSPWSSPYLLVPKPDGTSRFCVNYKKVNKLSKFDAYPMPRIQEIVDKIGPAKYITKLDLCKGYWQVPLTERSKQYTAFSTPLGLYQFKYLPFGLHGAPATFQRMMDRLLRGKEKFAAAYMDDLVIFSDEWEDHVNHVQDVLETLRQANLTAKPSKCSFAQTQVEYLGYFVGNGQIMPKKTKVEAIETWDQPKTKRDVRAFLGVSGYYRKFIPHYADIAAPLTDLTRKKCPEVVEWTPACEKAFQTLKDALCSEPILKMPDFTLEFILQTDASDRGLGAVLSQVFDGKEHPVVYLSRKLLPREQNYATIEKECLAVKWAIETLQYYLLGREFKIITDHQPLKWLNEAKENNKRLTRWSLDLQPYCFRVEHKKGSSHTNADGLSRKFK